MKDVAGQFFSQRLSFQAIVEVMRSKSANTVTGDFLLNV